MTSLPRGIAAATVCALLIASPWPVAAGVAQPASHATGRRPRASAGESRRPIDLDADGCGSRDGVFVHGSRSSDAVAVTFDACPTSRSPGFAPEIVDLLEREKVPTTFFVSGRWAETHPEAFARLRGVPFFEIALHGHRHRHLVHGAPEAMLAEITDGRAALAKLGAVPEPIFRPPFGDAPAELAEVARRAGVVAVTWDTAPGDPDPQVTAAAIERGVVERVQAGSIVVLHANGRGVGTPKALPGLIAGLRARGLRLVRASEILAPCLRTEARGASAGPSVQPSPTPSPNGVAEPG